MKAFCRVFTFLLLLAVAGAVFYFGWVQFKIKPNNCGVLISKTSGIYDKPIVPGVFLWRYETLIPTNAEIRVFSMEPYVVVKTIDGDLPSSEIYSLQLKETPDFSYSFSFRISLKFTPEGILSKVKESDVQNDSQLQKELDVIANLMSKYCISEVFEKSNGFGALNPIYIEKQFDFKEILNDFCKQNEVELVSFIVESAKYPDFELYSIAKKSFTEYRALVDEQLKEEAVKEAMSIIQEDRNFRRLEKTGELFRKYPELSELIKNGVSVETLQNLNRLE